MYKVTKIIRAVLVSHRTEVVDEVELASEVEVEAVVHL
jgi:hypothetical protein